MYRLQRVQNWLMTQLPLINIEHLQVDFQKEKEWHTVVHDSSFSIFKNEILGVVGESGSGKSVTSLAIMGLLPENVAKISHGKIEFNGQDITHFNEKSFQALRGNKVAMIFQEPMSALNPTMKCGEQVAEMLRTHTQLKEKEILAEVFQLFKKVKLPDPRSIYSKYPHQISGGQKQRVMIAMAIASKPLLLIADEPTTALDATVQKDIIDLLKELQQETGMGMLFISHDLELVSSIANRIIVMFQGNIAEQGTAKDVFHYPKELYTQALIASRPSTEVRLKKLPTISDFTKGKVLEEIVDPTQRITRHNAIYSQSPLLEVRHVFKDYITNSSLFSKGKFTALSDISFNVYAGETLGLVGESGCGKSTLGNVILQLDKATSGQIFYRGKDITQLKKGELRALRKDIQIIFQDPYSSLNPRKTIGEAIVEPMEVHRLYKNKAERKQKALEILERVGLNAEMYNRYPHEFSGGQRQRIGIARTIAVQPKLIICDESVSALDISVQAQVLNLLNELKENLGFTYIFISHDLTVVKYMADQIMVMNKGKIEEKGEADAVYAHPQSNYTQKLIDSVAKGI